MPEPLICETVAAPTMDALRRARDAATGADIVEVRLDGVAHPDVRAILAGRRQPVVVTCRAAWEGGRFDGTEEERERILAEAIGAGADFVDVEARAAFAPRLLELSRGRGIVLSAHLAAQGPTDLAALALEMRATGAEVVKIAVTALALTDGLPLFDLGRTLSDIERGRTGHVLLAMGAAGFPSRVLAARLGNRWTYAGEAVAPGQVPVARLLGELQFRRIAADFALYGVVGNPVMHSLSPAMHNAGFAALGLRAAYLPLEARDAEDFVAFAEQAGLRGASITAPFKVALLPSAVEVDAAARAVGAINTLTFRDGRWVGANTDVDGITAPLLARVPLKDTRVTVLGAGGAARAAAVALRQHGAAVSVSARHPAAAEGVARATGSSPTSWPPAPGSWDVLVNATPAGSTAQPGNPIEGTALDGRVVFDLVYDPPETSLLREARAAGCVTIGGLEMLVAQGERQFELWTGQRPPQGLFEAAAATAMRRRHGLEQQGEHGEADHL